MEVDGSTVQTAAVVRQCSTKNQGEQPTKHGAAPLQEEFQFGTVAAIGVQCSNARKAITCYYGGSWSIMCQQQVKSAKKNKCSKILQGLVPK